MNLFDHTDVQLPNDAVFKISPSSIAKFFDYPSVWYREQVLKEDGFQGNTATVLGTCVHYVAEQVAQGKPVNVDYVHSQLDTVTNPDVNISEVKSSWQELANELVERYVSRNIPVKTEDQIFTHIDKGIYVAGSVDALAKSSDSSYMIVDYKTASKKPSENIPFHYLIQLMAYAYIYRANGINVDKIRLVYAVRPTKTLPIRIIPVTKMITQDDWNLIEDTLQLMTETLVYAKEHPETVHLLFKSMSLKKPTKKQPILFD